jgi:autotransporter-associated beta strand protein
MHRIHLLIAAIATLALAPLAAAQTNGTWTGVASGNWSVASNWLGGTIPDAGGTAFLNDFTGQTVGHTLTVDTTPRTLSQINWNSSYSMSIGTSGGAVINMSPSGLTFNVVRSLSNSPVTTFVANSVTGQISGTGDLTKTGPGMANISNTSNNFVGSVNINEGLLWNNSGSDAVYGNAANAINLNGGIMGVATNALTSARVINVNQDSTLRNTVALTLNTGNQLRGSATLIKDQTGGVTIGAANPNFTGGLRIDQGTITLSGTGSIAGGGPIGLSGAVTLSNTATAVNNRLGNRDVIGRGGDINLSGNASTAVNETLGTYFAVQGQGFITVTPATSSTVATDLRLDALLRANNATVFFRGANLGATSGAGVGNVYVTNSPGTLIGGGGDPNLSTNASILPWAWGLASATGTTGASFVTWDSVSQRIIPLNVATGYNTDINAAAATDNVNLVAATEIVAAPTTVNSLRFGLTSGTTQTVSGSQITVTSGAIMSSSPLATAPTVNVTAPITSGGAEMVIFSTAGTSTTTPQFQLNGVLSGSGGLTRNGPGSLLIGNAGNDYSGTTTFNGGTTIVPGSVVDVASANAPSVFGTSGDIVLNGSGGTVRVRTTGNLVINRDVVARLGHAGTLGIGTAGNSSNESVTINGNVNLLATTGGFYTNYLSLEGGSARPQAVTINGVVSGGGGLRGFSGGYTILNNANTYSGGTILGATGFATGSGPNQGTQGETWEIGNDAAFGTGTIWIQNFLSGTSNVPAPGTMVAGGGPRTITNPIVTVSGYARTAGSNPLTWAGPVNLNGSAQGATAIIVGQDAPLTISGEVTGGGLVKNGPGTLTLSGNNTYSGRTVIRAGVLSVGTIGNGGTVGNLGQAPTAASYILLGGPAATETGTLRYTGAGETTNRLFSFTGYGGTIDASGSGPLVFSNTGTNTANSAFSSITGATVVAGTSVISVGNINAENIPVGTVITNSLFPAGTTVTESGVNFIRLSNLPSAGGTGQTITFSSFPSDFRRTLQLTGTNTGLNTIAGSIGQAATVTTNVVKSGPGTWNLTGASAYSGGTAVNGGRLLVNNTTGSATGTGPVAVNAGILGGAGFIGGATTVFSGAEISPGNSVGTLTVNNAVNLNTGSIFHWEINGYTPLAGGFNTGASTDLANHDQLASTGTFTGGDFVLKISEIAAPTYTVGDTYSWTIATGVGTPTIGTVTFDLTSAPVITSLGGAAQLLLSVNAGQVNLNFTPVPEPATVLGIAAGAAGVAGLIRRRFRKTAA